MKTFFLTVIAVIAISHFSFSQTKRIMHRSHSGSDTSLWMDDSEDSFGLSRPMENEMRKSAEKSDSIAAAQKKADSINAAKSTKKAPQKKSNPKKTTAK